MYEVPGFDEADKRYKYGFSQDKSGKKGFFKITKQPEENANLQREVAGMDIAANLGLPTVSIYDPYVETAKGRGLMHVEQLEVEHGTVLANNELLASADPEFGARYAQVVGNLRNSRIPKSLDTTFLKAW